MPALSIAKQFSDLRAISPVVEHYLTEELYKNTFGATEYTIEDVLQECYAIVYSELIDFGITFDSEEDNLLGDWYMARKIYYIRLLIDPENLKQTLALCPNLEKIDALVASDEEESGLFNNLVDTLLLSDPENYQLNQIQDLANIIISNHDFTLHVQNIIDIIHENGLNFQLPELKSAQAYIDKITGLRKYARIAVEKITSTLSAKLGMLDWKKINHLLDIYDMDKLSPDTLKIYALVDGDKELPDHLTAYKNAMMLAHHRRAAHHIEYWTDPAKDPEPVPTVENLILLVAHLHEPDTDGPSFWKEFSEMLDDGLSVFTMDQIDLMGDMGNVLFPRI